MKTESKIMLPLGAFFAIATVAYVFLGRVDGQIEWAGTAALGLTFVMIMMIWFTFYGHGRSIDMRPEDDLDGEVADGAGEIGFFPPASIWPFWCSICAGLMLLGPVFGWWLTIMGSVLGVWAVAGWCYQYYRGAYQH